MGHQTRNRYTRETERLQRKIRPSVMFRKVTNGFRSEWGAETSADFRSVVSTTQFYRASVLDALRLVLLATPAS